MANKTTTITVDFQCSQQTAMTLISQWLQANSFVQQNDNGFIYYQSNDAWSNKGFYYRFTSANQVVLDAYIGTYKKHDNIEGVMGYAVKIPYSNSVNTLVTAIKSAPAENNMQYTNPASQYGNNFDPNTGAPISQPVYTQQTTNSQPNNGQAVYGQQVNGQQVNSQQTYGQASQDITNNAFDAQVQKRNGGFAIAGFVVSIVCLILPFLGLTAGLVLIFFCIAAAVAGLKSTKKGLAIATFPIAGISLIISILNIVLSALS